MKRDLNKIAVTGRDGRIVNIESIQTPNLQLDVL